MPLANTSLHQPLSRFPILAVHTLDCGMLLAVRNRKAGRIRCLEGSVLVSLQGCFADYELTPGMTLDIQGNPLVLIESCEDARVVVEASARHCRGMRPALGALLLLILASALAFNCDNDTEKSKAVWHASHDRIANAKAWRAGRNMIDPDGEIATNRVISTYERMHLSGDQNP